MTLSIRAAGPELIDVLDALWLELHEAQGSTALPINGVPLRSNDDTGPIVHDFYVEVLESPDGFAFLAEDEEPVGYLLGTVTGPSEIWDTGRIGHIDSFYVRADQRGRGIGGMLLDAAYEELRRRGVSTVGLDVVSTNADAIRLYERHDFTPTLLHMYRRLDAERSD
jgi:ribosomal protein S18 acetylase RimI-like enzyme